MNQYEQSNKIEKKEINGLWVLLFFVLMLIVVGILAKLTT